MLLPIIDNNDNIEYLNKKFIDSLGYNINEFANINEFWTHACPDIEHRQLIIGTWSAAIEKAKELNSEIEPTKCELNCKNGAIKIFEISGAIINHKKIVYFNDITKKIIAEKKLKKSRTQLLEAQRIGKIGNWEWTLSDNSLFWSDEMYEIFGIDKNKSFTALETIDFFHPDDIPFVNLATKKTIDEKLPQTIDCRIIKPDGELRYVHGTAELICDANGEIEKIIGVYQDITERKIIEETLYKTTTIFKAILENSPYYIFIKDNEIKTLFLSKNYENMLGIPIENAIGKDMYELFPSELAKQMIANDKKIIEDGELINVEEEFDGRIYNTIKFPIKIENQPTMLAGFTIDISERKRYETALLESDARLEKAMKAGKIAWWELELPSGKVNFSELKTGMLGYNPDDFKFYQDFTKLLHPDDYELAMNAMRDHISGLNEKYEVEYRIKDSKGEYLWFKDLGQITERNAENSSLIISGIVIDITERKVREQEIIFFAQSN